MSPSRTKQGPLLLCYAVCSGLFRIFFVFLVDLIHHDFVDALQLVLILNGAENFFSILLNSLQNADLQIFILFGICGNKGIIIIAFQLQHSQNLQQIFFSIFISDGDNIVAIQIAHGVPPACFGIFILPCMGPKIKRQFAAVLTRLPE